MYAIRSYYVSKLPTSVASLYAYINPVVAVYLGWLILDETITANAILGMLVIFAGVAMVQKRRPRSDTPMVPPIATAEET